MTSMKAEAMPLFAQEQGVVHGPALPEEPPLFWEEIATRKTNTPGWRWSNVRTIGEQRDFLLMGGVPRILKSGPRKGTETWDGVKLTEVIVTRAEVNAATLAYEAETGRCRRCAGSKVHMTASCVTRGITYSTCWHCGGTGKPVAVSREHDIPGAA